ncbi:MAG: hypothetical protein ACP5RP_01670 [Candidatus Micrarchaeia archaeon]
MPTKGNMSKYELFVYNVHKLGLQLSSVRGKCQKYNNAGYWDADYKTLKAGAVIVAAFSSNFSWKTHQTVVEGTLEFDKNEIKDEYMMAATKNWQKIEVRDIKELVNSGLSYSAFNTWLFFNVTHKEYSIYIKAWKRLNEEFFKSENEEILEVVR